VFFMCICRWHRDS